MDNDLHVLSQQTRLSETKLELLLEEDGALLLDNIPGLSQVSFPFFVRHTILRETKGRPFDSSEKEYVTQSIVLFPKLSETRSPYVIDKQRLGEDEGRYYLVLLGIFPQVINKIYHKGGPAPEFYAQVAKRSFKQTQPRISEHTFEWIDALRHIRDFIWY